MGDVLRLHVLAIERLGQHPDVRSGRLGMGGAVDTVLDGEEHGACGEHDGRIVDDPRVVESDQVVDGLLKEGVPLFCEHEIV